MPTAYIEELILFSSFPRLPQFTAIVLLLLLGGASCSVTARKNDEMCREIALFANSADAQPLHSVELFTDWRGAFSNDENVVAEKACKRDGSESGKRLCQFLLANTSPEFAEINFRRALSCLPGAQIFAGPLSSRVEYLNGKITSDSAKGVRPDVRVSVEFSTGSGDHAPSLKIGAQRLQPGS